MRKARKSADRVKTPFSQYGRLRPIIIALFLISGAVNILALTGSFYMLQVYDRTLTSQSLPTLFALSLLAAGLFAVYGGLDVLRSQVLVRIGARLDHLLAPAAHRVAMDMPRYGFSSAEAAERGRDVDTLRSFIAGQGPIALFDLPWLPVFLLFVYILHPWLGFLTLGGALVLCALTFLTEVLMQRRSADAQKASVERAMIVDTHARNSEIIRALGMTSRAVDRFEKANSAHLATQTLNSGVAGTFGGMSKAFRMMLQSAVLGLGAYLTIKGEMTAGSIIAASVSAGRALAPADLVISHWKSLVAARKSYTRLTETLTALDQAPPSVALPPPKRSVTVEKVTAVAPGTGVVVLSDIGFELKAGQAVGIIGPSGGGKSSLARVLAGVWPTLRGDVRLDGADIEQWAPDAIGASIGYLPQDVSLMDATVAENIARLADPIDQAAVLDAAVAAGVHDMIVRLQEGYETKLGPMGMALSAGQRQRIALARALYGNPFLVVLDEPNSNLDAAGDAALNQAIRSVCDRGGIVIIVSHRPSALAAVELVGVVQGGRLTAFGPKDQVIGQHLEVVPGSKTAAPRRAAKAS